MGKELAEKYPVARQTFEEADDALGYKLSQLCFEGPEEKLRMTEITQPAILTASVAAWRVLQEKGVSPSFVAGHSLGEYSAHVAAGTLNFSDAVRTVRNRGKYMQEAVPVGVGAMAAILGMDPGKGHGSLRGRCPGRSLRARQYQFIRADRDLRAHGRGRARHQAGQRTRRQAGDHAIRQRSFSLLADEACPGPVGRGLSSRSNFKSRRFRSCATSMQSSSKTPTRPATLWSARSLVR